MENLVPDLVRVEVFLVLFPVLHGEGQKVIDGVNVVRCQDHRCLYIYLPACPVADIYIGIMRYIRIFEYNMITTQLHHERQTDLQDTQAYHSY